MIAQIVTYASLIVTAANGCVLGVVVGDRWFN